MATRLRSLPFLARSSLEKHLFCFEQENVIQLPWCDVLLAGAYLNRICVAARLLWLGAKGKDEVCSRIE